jgi:hypothetical protein
MTEPVGTTFSSLFKKHRLRSELATLSEFGRALADEGVVYEDSLFYRWQNNTRTPRQRNILLAVIRVFIKRRGITSIEETNTLLASVGQRDLMPEEAAALPFLLTKSPCTVPAMSADFIGRTKTIKEICWSLLNRQTVLLHGMAGVGKTMLAMYCGHFLKKTFRDGVLWYRFDLRSAEDIFNDIARLYGEDISKIQDVRVKARQVHQLLAQKDVLLILDNVDDFSHIDLFMKEPPRIPLLLTSKRYPDLGEHVVPLKIETFTAAEVNELAQHILGRAYVMSHQTSIQHIAREVHGLPLALMVIFKHAMASPHALKRFMHGFHYADLQPGNLHYDDKNLELSLHISFQSLSPELQNTCIWLGMFAGSDFSAESVASIAKESKVLVTKYLRQLESLSFVEKSLFHRYRVHPFIMSFFKRKIQSEAPYRELARYFIRFLEKGGRGNRTFYPHIEQELDNIIGIFFRCKELHAWKEIIQLWEYLGIFLWDTGRWREVNTYGRIVCTACRRQRNHRALATCLIRELCWLQYWRGDLKTALSSVQSGMKIAERLEDEPLLALAWIRLGKIYESKRRCHQALTCFMRAFAYFGTQHNQEKQGDILTYIGETYWLMENHTKAKLYLRRALRIVRTINDIPQEITIVSRLGCIALQEKHYTQAITQFRKSLLLEKTSGRRVGDTFWNNLALGLTYEKLGKHRVAQEKYQLAKNEMILVGFNEQILRVDVFPMIFKKDLIRSGFLSAT